MLFLGGHTISDAGWSGYGTVFVDFQSQYTSGWLWQLYAGRTLIGRTTSPTDRTVEGQIDDAITSPTLTLLRVDPTNVLTDYGSQLPPIPCNQFKLEWSASSFPDDADHFDITGSRSAGGSADPSNIIARVPFMGDAAYQYILPPIDSSGVWEYAVTSRDDAQPLGNAGAVATVTVDAVVAPPDVEFDDAGNRFELAVAGGVVTADFFY